jgi:hypothetical protein
MQDAVIWPVPAHSRHFGKEEKLDILHKLKFC